MRSPAYNLLPKGRSQDYLEDRAYGSKDHDRRKRWVERVIGEPIDIEPLIWRSPEDDKAAVSARLIGHVRKRKKIKH